MRFIGFLLFVASTLALVNANNFEALNSESHAQCNACCAKSGTADDSACTVTKQLNGQTVTSQLQCCGIIGNSAFCCPSLPDGETSCKYVNIPFFQKYTCGSSSSSPATTVAPTSTSTETETTQAPADSDSPSASSSSSSSSSSHSSQSNGMKTLDSVVVASTSESTAAPAAGQQLDTNGNQSSSASSTLAWWIWFLISIGILLFVICVVLTIFRCCLDVTCSLL